MIFDRVLWTDYSGRETQDAIIIHQDSEASQLPICALFLFHFLVPGRRFASSHPFDIQPSQVFGCLFGECIDRFWYSYGMYLELQATSFGMDGNSGDFELLLI